LFLFSFLFPQKNLFIAKQVHQENNLFESYLAVFKHLQVGINQCFDNNALIKYFCNKEFEKL